MKKARGLIDQIKSDEVYGSTNTNFTLEDIKQLFKELHTKTVNKPGIAMHLTNRLGTFKIVDGFWAVLLTDESYLPCECPYDAAFNLKDKITIA